MLNNCETASTLATLDCLLARQMALLEREAEDMRYAYQECRDPHQRDRLYQAFKEVDREYQQAVVALRLIDQCRLNGG